MTRSSSRRRAALTSLACLLLSACDTDVRGTPQAAPSVSTTPSTSATSDNPFAGLTPCSVVDQALAGQGFPPAQPSVAGSRRSCASNKAGDANVGVALQAGQRYTDDITNPQQAEQGDVSGRPAILEREPLKVSGQCSISMEARPGSRVIVSVSIGAGTTDMACERVQAIAPMVEKLLQPNT